MSTESRGISKENNRESAQWWIGHSLSQITMAKTFEMGS